MGVWEEDTHIRHVDDEQVLYVNHPPCAPCDFDLRARRIDTLRVESVIRHRKHARRTIIVLFSICFFVLRHFD